MAPSACLLAKPYRTVTSSCSEVAVSVRQVLRTEGQRLSRHALREQTTNSNRGKVASGGRGAVAPASAATGALPFDERFDRGSGNSDRATDVNGFEVAESDEFVNGASTNRQELGGLGNLEQKSDRAGPG